MRDSLTIVEFSLVRASIGPEATESIVPYISILPPKLCSIHLFYVDNRKYQTRNRTNIQASRGVPNTE